MGSGAWRRSATWTPALSMPLMRPRFSMRLDRCWSRFMAMVAPSGSADVDPHGIAQHRRGHDLDVRPDPRPRAQEDRPGETRRLVDVGGARRPATRHELVAQPFDRDLAAKQVGVRARVLGDRADV